jgi:hypothetical protein
LDKEIGLDEESQFDAPPRGHVAAKRNATWDATGDPDDAIDIVDDEEEESQYSLAPKGRVSAVARANDPVST